MNLQEAQHKLSADISQLYETYQLISKSKQQFNDLDVALLQQQLLHVYHSLLKVQSQLAGLPQSTVLVDEVLPLVGLKPEPAATIIDVAEETPLPPIEVLVPNIEPPITEVKIAEPEIEETPLVDKEEELTFNFKTMPQGEQEPTLDDLEKIMQAHEQAEEAVVAEPIVVTEEPETVKVQTTLSFELPKTEEPKPEQVVVEQPVAETSLLNKLSASLKTGNDVVEKITREQQQSLKQAINLNKKIAFVNNLFKENTVEYAKAIEKLNACSSMHEALRYFNELKHQYNWNNDNALVKDLEQLVEKRYS